MRFESVTAHAFGPLVDTTLHLTPGLTVIYGPNESGKSTWHAALYAGLCGMRRGRGQPTTEERGFAQRHRPWDGHRWEVGVHVQLDEGRRVELRHNLADRVGQATDLMLGRDITQEIINDGSPDGARWLGMDRASFQATACVRQADILSVLHAADELEQHLARAAATARADATAAEAIARLEAFRATHVGSERAPTRPLRQAQDRVREAGARLEKARAVHQASLELVTQAEELRQQAEALRGELRFHEAAAALRDAHTWERRAARVRELSTRFRDGSPVPLAEEDELAQRVAAAVAGWEDRPRVADLQGPSAADLQRQIEGLPPMPEGDLEPHCDVAGAQQAYEDARRGLALHDEARPLEPAAPAAGGASEEELWELARDLETPEPHVDPELQRRVDQAKRRVDQLGARPGATWLVAVAVLGAVAGMWLVVADLLIPGLLLLVAGAGVVAWWVMTGTARTRALEELRAAENAMGETRHAAADVARRKEAARARAVVLGVPMDPAALRALAEAVSTTVQQRRELDRWAGRRATLADQVASSERVLATVLRARAVDLSDGVDRALARYLSQCAERAGLATEARRRSELESHLAARVASEDAQQRADAAERGLMEVATACGVAGESPEELYPGLKAWQAQRTEALEQHQAVLQEWAEFQTLLAGRTLQEIEEEGTRRRETATVLAEGLDLARLCPLAQTPNLDDMIVRFRQEFEQASEAANRAQGEVRALAGSLPNVAEAEEELERATLTRDRVLRLQRTLDLTLQILGNAQDRAHRTIAPILARTVARFLPGVTAGRYTEATVDPETLKVRVRDGAGHLRDATALSHGTAEQVYLLLRVALAEHLARPGETCPLILDDATVQSDRVRTEAIMQCLHAVSRERQVIVFTQEDEVLEWAQRHLDSTQDRLVRLGQGA